jgi:hypothetical protein
VRASDDEGGFVALGGVSLLVAANFAPVAQLSASPGEGTLWSGSSVSISLDSSASTDDGSGTLLYAFDPEGDGSFGLAQSEDELGFLYTQSGIYLAAVRVTDDAGLSGYAYALTSIRQADGFKTRFPDIRGGSGLNPAAAMINGRPAVAYFNSFGGGLFYVRALDAHGATWSAPVTIDATVPTILGAHCSLALIGGSPAIAYSHNGDGQIKYLRATDGAGLDEDAWPDTPLTVEASAAVTNQLFLIDANGSPGVAWISNQLRFERAGGGGDNAGDWAGAALSVSPDFVGRFGLQMVGGRPAFVYSANSNCIYERALLGNGDSAGDWSGAGIDVDDGNTPNDLALAVIGSRPAIVFATANEMQYQRALDSAGDEAADWPGLVTLSAFNGNYVGLSLAEMDGRPALAYCVEVAGNQQCCFSLGLDADGGAWTGNMRATDLEIGHTDGLRTSVISAPGWCGIATELTSGDRCLEFNSLGYE